MIEDDGTKSTEEIMELMTWMWCTGCNRRTVIDTIPFRGTVCAFCWPAEDLEEFYTEWWQRQFINIVGSGEIVARKIDDDGNVYEQHEPGDLSFHHKAPSQAVIRCINTVVHDSIDRVTGEPNPPDFLMMERALYDCYITGRYRIIFEEWRIKMRSFVFLIYCDQAVREMNGRKKLAKFSRGRQTLQLKLPLFEVPKSDKRRVDKKT